MSVRNTNQLLKGNRIITDLLFLNCYWDHNENFPKISYKEENVRAINNALNNILSRETSMSFKGLFPTVSPQHKWQESWNKELFSEGYPTFTLDTQTASCSTGLTHFRALGETNQLHVLQSLTLSISAKLLKGGRQWVWNDRCNPHCQLKANHVF